MLTHLLKRVFPLLMLVNLTLPLVYVSKALHPAWRLSAINFAAFVVKTFTVLCTYWRDET